ncbi:hypothetical protein M9H77_29232 [Catharanthus roseus]|uniref:Uncharacterized protein n=1 Tax=Catharanthus roseus TaxID=4058 RepID=A0ACC0AIJ3_CATRO|nr:hypothetical protein M9H77_29232 [Catharanthus roseus]
MATTTVKLLHLRSGYRPITTSPTPIRFFSSSNPFETPNESSTQPNSNSPPPPPPQSQSPYTNYLSDVKARLKQQQPGNTRSPGTPFGFSSNIKDVEEMRKRLSEFRQRFPVSSPPSPPSSTSQSSQHISLGKIYERVTSGGQESSSAGSISYGKHSWLDIKEKLNKVRNTTPKNQNDKVGRINDSMSLSRYQESLSLKPGDRSEREPMVIGGGANLASSIFAKELGEKQGANVNGAVGIQFAKIYKPEDLGEKLRSLRPEKKGKNWFSLEELNERLKKVREIDEEESKSATGETQIVRALKDSLVVLSNNIEIEKGKAKNAENGYPGTAW